MANAEHLGILRQGVDIWNPWREEQVDLRPDLRGACLAGADLNEANLSGADLARADISGADLSEASLLGANLVRADIIGADLSGASLFGAHLSWANFREANLSEADLLDVDLHQVDLHGVNLRGADLRGATLQGANLGEADLSGCIAGYTIFADIDLSVARGLEAVVHEGPSTIGIDTFFRSKGDIPEAFLRGAGVPEPFIEYARSLVGQAIQYYSCFISYSNKDKGLAERLYADLQANQVRCWYAPEDMKTGDRIRDTIDRAVRLYDKLLLILSESSIGSQWVEQEVEGALAKERERESTILFPIRKDDAVMDEKTGWAAYLKNTRHIGDFRDWKDHDAYQKAFERLLRDLSEPSEGLEPSEG